MKSLFNIINNIKKSIFIQLLTTFVYIILVHFHVNAQDGIPVENPDNMEGVAISLQSKDQNKGIVLPVVELISLDSYAPVDGSEQIGTFVYNMADNPEKNITPGIYSWSYNKWVKLLDNTSNSLLPSSTLVYSGKENPNNTNNTFLQTAPIGSIYINIITRYVYIKTGEGKSKDEKIDSWKVASDFLMLGYKAGNGISITQDTYGTKIIALRLGSGFKLDRQTGSVSLKIDDKTLSLNSENKLAAKNNYATWNANLLNNRTVDNTTDGILIYNQEQDKWLTKPLKIQGDGLYVGSNYEWSALVDNLTLSNADYIKANNNTSIWNANKINNIEIDDAFKNIKGKNNILTYNKDTKKWSVKVISSGSNIIDLKNNDNRITVGLNIDSLTINENQDGAIIANNQEAIWNADSLQNIKLNITGDGKAEAGLVTYNKENNDLTLKLLTGGNGLYVYNNFTNNKKNWKIVDFSSQEAIDVYKGYAKSVTDDDLTTKWMSEWRSKVEPYPHFITIDMQEELFVKAFVVNQYKNSQIKDYKIEVSDDNFNWATVKAGELRIDDNIDQILSLKEPKKFRYFKFTALSQAHNDYEYTTAALREIGVILAANNTKSRQKLQATKNFKSTKNGIKIVLNLGDNLRLIEGDKLSAYNTKPIWNANKLNSISISNVVPKEGNILVFDNNWFKPMEGEPKWIPNGNNLLQNDTTDKILGIKSPLNESDYFIIKANDLSFKANTKSIGFYQDKSNLMFNIDKNLGIKFSANNIIIKDVPLLSKNDSSAKFIIIDSANNVKSVTTSEHMWFVSGNNNSPGVETKILGFNDEKINKDISVLYNDAGDIMEFKPIGSLVNINYIANFNIYSSDKKTKMFSLIPDENNSAKNKLNITASNNIFIKSNYNGNVGNNNSDFILAISGADITFKGKSITFDAKNFIIDNFNDITNDNIDFDYIVFDNENANTISLINKTALTN